MVFEEFDVFVFGQNFLFCFVQEGKQLWDSHFFVDFRGVFDFFGGNTETEGGYGFGHVVGVRRAGHDQTGFGVATQ